MLAPRVRKGQDWRRTPFTEHEHPFSPNSPLNTTTVQQCRASPEHRLPNAEHEQNSQQLSAAEPKTYRITSEKDSYHDFIGSGTLINAVTVKLILRGLNLEYAIPLANVQEVSEDAVGKFDVGSKLQLSESIIRGP